jgi:sec-independent protein translocase protein TatA
MFGWEELLVLFLILLLIFGGRKLPELARGLGKAVSVFRKASKEDAEDEEKPKKRKK